MPERESITVEVLVQAPLETTWKCFTQPEHVVAWNNASADWHTPKAENDLRTGGTFNYRMEAKDGSTGFDFGGTYDAVEPLKKISYTMDDGRKVLVNFEVVDNATKVTETFDAESENSLEMQRAGWQSILDNFKRHAESDT